MHALIMILMLSTAAEARTDQEQELLATSYDTGDVEELRSILATGVDINVKSSVGRTALHHTCLKGYAEAAQLLLGKGADVEATSDGGWTALMLASFAGHTAIARALLEKGAAIERVNVIGKSALDYARQASRSEVVKLLEAAASQSSGMAGKSSAQRHHKHTNINKKRGRFPSSSKGEL